MANRPIFVPRISSPPFVDEIMLEFKWIPGMAVSQKKKNVVSLHLAAQQKGIQPVLEISTKSQLALGEALSAFNLKLDVQTLGRIPVEAAFQGSKVFQGGGPYREFYRMSGREIRSDERLRNSGGLLRFDFSGETWGLEPKTAFYDWLYLTALCQNPTLSSQLLSFKGFTDIEFNPEKSLNCQARSAALYVALMRKEMLEQAMQSKSNFLSLVYSKQKSSAVSTQQFSLIRANTRRLLLPKIDITRTELVWPGKYDEDGNLVPPRRVSLPFQVIERVSETRATRQQRESEKKGHVATLFDYWQEGKAQTTEPGDGWRNKLIWGDNLYVMGSLLDKFAGKFDLIYIDPPFATGIDFSIDAAIGENDEITKEQSIIEEKVYRDTWGEGLDSYLKMIYERLVLLREFLSSTGTMYVHLDWHIGHYVKQILDDIFGRDNFVNEITWHYYNKFAPVSKCFPRASDRIISYAASFGQHIFNKQEEEREEPVKQLKRKFIDGKAINIRDEDGNVQYQVKTTKRVDDVWRISMLQPADKTEYTGFQTQKPEAVLERIIRASSNSESLVADFFCGSGTTLAVAEKLGRRWMGCDLGRYAIHTTRKRMMGIPNCKPFEILNLGRYERQVWQGVTFAGEKQTQQMLIFEYLKFILELYGAQPLAGTQVLHGKKGSAVVHVGAVDAPVTIDEVIACLDECKQMGQKELHILGWEWEMGLANLMVDEAKGQGIKLLMLTIPREVMEQRAVEKGDIHFYELAYLETDIQVKGRKVTVALTDFVIPNDELIPPEVRQKIKKWSDYVDYWAVDWDFQNDTFVNGWTSYRTRKDRTLQLRSEAHEYPATGNYRVVIKVIDIFGNDTSQVFEVQVA